MPSRRPAALRRESFVRGAMIVTLAGLVSRLLGAFYKPIVTRLFSPFDGRQGDLGVGLIQSVYPVYGIVLAVSAYGINVAISRLVAERVATGREEEVPRVFRISLALMAGLGLVLSIAMYLAAPALARAVGAPEATMGFMAIAPAILFVSVMAAFRGLFQGLQVMTPYALSQVYEQIVRILTGILLIYLLTQSKETVHLGAAGYNFGAVTGALIGLAYLAWVYLRQRGNLLHGGIRAAAAAEVSPVTAAPGNFGGPQATVGAGVPVDAVGVKSTWGIVRSILRLSVPISVIAAVQQLVQFADSLLVINRLTGFGVAADTAKAFLGQIGNSYAITYLPPILTNALYVSLVPAITESLARGNRDQARARSTVALRLTMLFGLPATAGIWLFAHEIYMLFGGGGGPVLRSLSLLTLFMMLQQTTSGILQGSGDIATPVRNFLTGLMVKVALNYWWIGLPALGIHGAAYASVTAFAVAAALNMWAVWRKLGVGMDLVGMWLKPLAASAGMVAVGWLVDTQLTALIGRPFVSALMAMAVAAAAYFGLMLAIGGFQAADIEVFPRIGPRMVALLRRLRLLRR